MKSCFALALCALIISGIISGCSQADRAITDRVPEASLAVTGSADAPGDLGSAGKGFNATHQNTSDVNGIDQRKIIYSASIRLKVEKFDGVESRIDAVIQSHGGYVASANLDRMQGEQRSGHWTARVPVEEFSSFVNAVSEIGVPVSRTQKAQEITEEYVDLQSRINNKQKLEARVQQLLERPGDKLTQVIEVEHELARVREDIERMQARLRVLADRSSLATITIDILEERAFVPEAAPNFSQRIASAWRDSIESARNLIEDCVVFIVGHVFGIVLVATFLLAFLLVARTLLRRYGAAARRLFQ